VTKRGAKPSNGKGKSRKKAAPTARRQRRALFVPPEWVRACNQIAAAFASEEVRETVSPFSAFGPKTLSETAKRCLRSADIAHQALVSELPRAMNEFAASHPPCRETPLCIHVALIETLVENAFEAGQIQNPTVEFRKMWTVFDRYMKRLS